MSDSDVVTVPKGESGGQLAPVLPLRDIVVFPHMIVPLFVGREKSVRALEEVMNDEKQILLLTQKHAADDDPTPDGLHTIGTLATVLQLLKLPDQTVRVLVEGKSRAEVTGFTDRQDFFQAKIQHIPETGGEARETEALVRTVKTNFEQYIKLNKKVPAETLASVAQIEDPAKLADTVASHLSVKIPDRQQLLETLNVSERLERVLALIEGEIGVLQVERKIRQPREAPDGEDAARVLPQRTAQGDPEGAGRRRRRPRRARRNRRAHPQDQAVEGSAREGACGDEEAPLDEPDERRSHGRAQLSRLAAVAALGQEVQGQEGHRAGREDPARRSLRPRQGQGTHPRISGRAAARRQDEGADPVPRRPAGRRQDLARQVDRQGHGPRICAHEPRRRARRSGNPRPPAHLYRLDAGQGDPVDEEGQERQPALPAGRDRQAGRGLARRSFERVARSARPRAEPHLQRSLSGGRFRSVGCDVHHHGELAAHAAAADGPHGDHPHPRLHRG